MKNSKYLIQPSIIMANRGKTVSTSWLVSLAMSTSTLVIPLTRDGARASQKPLNLPIIMQPFRLQCYGVVMWLVYKQGEKQDIGFTLGGWWSGIEVHPHAGTLSVKTSSVWNIRARPSSRWTHPCLLYLQQENYQVYWVQRRLGQAKCAAQQ